jgi:hypothetical protein
VSQPRGADLTPQLSGRSLLAFLRRWGLLVEPRSVLPLVVPTAQVDRFYPRSELDIWGCFSEYVATVAGRWPACMLLAGEKTVVVRRIDAHLMLEDRSWPAPLWHQFHVFSPPLAQYNPCAFDPGFFFPFCSSRGALLPNPGALVVSGYQTGIGTVTVNGSPVALVGPSYAGPFDAFRATFEWDDPPLTVRPFEALAVQSLTPRLGTDDPRLTVNFWWSEIEDEGL